MNDDSSAFCEIEELGYNECNRPGVVEAIIGDTLGGEEIGVWLCAHCFIVRLGGTVAEPADSGPEY